MAHLSLPRHPKNAPGPFYVEDDSCIQCEAPSVAAPDLIGTDDQRWGYHCYFRRQPETPEEVDRAVEACVFSCVRAVRYAGDDPAILEKFREYKSENSCDALGPSPDDPATWDDPPFPRNYWVAPPEEPHPLWDKELDG